MLSDRIIAAAVAAILTAALINTPVVAQSGLSAKNEQTLSTGLLSGFDRSRLADDRNDGDDDDDDDNDEKVPSKSPQIEMRGATDDRNYKGTAKDSARAERFEPPEKVEKAPAENDVRSKPSENQSQSQGASEAQTDVDSKAHESTSNDAAKAQEAGTHDGAKTHRSASHEASKTQATETQAAAKRASRSQKGSKTRESQSKAHAGSSEQGAGPADGSKAHSSQSKCGSQNKASLPGADKSSPGGKDKIRKKYLDTPPCLTWIDPDLEPKAAILCVHGLGLHNGTYKDFGERMAKLGYAVYAVDVRGFGSWMGAQGRQKVNFEGCLDDVHKTLKVIHRVHPKLPVFILGESMGGAIALRATSEHPELVHGLVSSVPSGDRFQQGKTTLRVALKLLTSPNKSFNVGESVVDQATKKPELKKMWCDDPLARMNLTPKELVQFQNFMNENHESVKKITTTPVLMVQGQKDQLVKPAGTISLFNKIPCQDKDMILITDAEHLIFEEGQFDDQVIEKVNAWLTGHLQRKNGQLTQK